MPFPFTASIHQRRRTFVYLLPISLHSKLKNKCAWWLWFAYIHRGQYFLQYLIKIKRSIVHSQLPVLNKSVCGLVFMSNIFVCLWKYILLHTCLVFHQYFLQCTFSSLILVQKMPLPKRLYVNFLMIHKQKLIKHFFLIRIP